MEIASATAEIDDLQVIMWPGCMPPAFGAAATSLHLKVMPSREARFSAFLLGKEHAPGALTYRSLDFNLRCVCVTTVQWAVGDMREHLFLQGDDVDVGITQLCVLAPCGTATKLSRASNGLLFPTLPLALVCHERTWAVPASASAGPVSIGAAAVGPTLELQCHARAGLAVLQMTAAVRTALWIALPGGEQRHARDLCAENAPAALVPGSHLWIEIGGCTLHVLLSPLLDGKPLLAPPKRDLGHVGGVGEGGASKSARGGTPTPPP